MINICIAMCTYRRPSIKATLLSISKQQLPDHLSIKVVVADNDETTKAQAFIEQLGREYGLALTYVHAPAKNISIARNACLDNAQADWIACIDDDEVASVHWVAELYSTAMKSKADVVFGPVQALYGKSAPFWMKKGDFHSQWPVYVKGAIKTGSTANALLKTTSPFVIGERFDLNLGNSGGEDNSYFLNIFENGGKLTFSENAMLYEDVPEERASLMWLIKRKFRFGQTHGAGLLKFEANFFNKIANRILPAIKFLFCLVMAAVCIFNSEKKYTWLLRGMLHLGVIAKLFGKSEITQYS